MVKLEHLFHQGIGESRFYSILKVKNTCSTQIVWSFLVFAWLSGLNSEVFWPFGTKLGGLNSENRGGLNSESV